MPTIITDGAASAQGYGFAARSVAANYIEDVFSTYLYTGNSTSGGTQTITNGVDLSTKGGMVWIKGRSAASNNVLFDTARGAGTTASNNQAISSNLTTAEDLGASYDFLSAFNADGFTVKQGGTTSETRGANYTNRTYASWTFREQPKFFDIVTYTGNGVSGRTISHNLGSVPGCIIVKSTSAGGTDWTVFHRSINAGRYGFIVLNQTNAAFTSTAYDWNPTSTTFIPQSWLNDNGATYVAYLFAHDAGGFGATGADNVISCGSFTTDGSGNATVSLGYEPQWLMVKNATTASNNEWRMVDNMRGFPVNDASSSVLTANSSAAEFTSGTINLLNTGFQIDGLANSATFIYIAIRRGPMKTPTTGTSVFNPDITSDSNATAGSLPVTDMTIMKFPWFNTSTSTYTTGGNYVVDRLRGGSLVLATNLTDSEGTGGTSPTGSIGNYVTGFDIQTGVKQAAPGGGFNEILWSFRRAPGFFDVVCYTGTGVTRTVAHNLAAVPELMIVKTRGTSNFWYVYSEPTGNTKRLFLDYNLAASVDNPWNNTSPTASVFTVIGSNDGVNYSGFTYVAYLFATVAGVSKVGSYTGTGTTKQIDCGFTAGARFVLIKRTDSTGDWYVWDSARGIVAGNDPYILLNSTAAEVTNTDYVDTYSAGFEISSTAPAAINANGGSFIFLAVA